MPDFAQTQVIFARPTMSAQCHKVSTLDTSLEEEVVLDHRTDLLGDKDNQYILDLEAGSKKEFTEPADD